MIVPLIRLTRPYYTLPLTAGLLVIAAYVTGGQLHRTTGPPAVALLALYGILSAAYILNDVCDVHVDAVNRPRRMLPSGQVSLRIALAAAVVLLVAGLILASICGRVFLAALALLAVGLAAYDVYSKRLGMFKSPVVALLTTALYPLAFAFCEPVNTPRLNVVLWIHPPWLFLTTLGYEMLKDTCDVSGDGLAGNTRWSARCGSPGFLASARAILLAASLLTLLPYALGYCNAVYLAAAILAIGLVALSLCLRPMRSIPPVYASVVAITAGSLADLWACGP
ncbi:MAG: UbiA family prenyltransferase [Thermoguttaceae bacterium]|jgi:4-hydroxybenzoate polyprenyltransferase|nr:UbiA family prenyltransferase [Thermoguttaceae bacterium]